MKKLYKVLHPIGRIVYVKGNSVESKRQWTIRNKEKARVLKNHSEHIRRCRRKETDINGYYILGLKANVKKCPDCGVNMISDGRKQNGKTLDHIIPLARGGKHVKKNVRVICRKCNLLKGCL